MPINLQTFGLISNNPVLKNITDYLVDEGSYEEEAYLGTSLRDLCLRLIVANAYGDGTCDYALLLSRLQAVPLTNRRAALTRKWHWSVTSSCCPSLTA